MVKKFGTRQQVWDEECTMTRGGLSKDDLVLSKAGRIVSKKNQKNGGAEKRKSFLKMNKYELLSQ